jgi:hypothetical protein
MSCASALDRIPDDFAGAAQIQDKMDGDHLEPTQITVSGTPMDS